MSLQCLENPLLISGVGQAAPIELPDCIKAWSGGFSAVSAAQDNGKPRDLKELVSNPRFCQRVQCVAGDVGCLH